MALVQTVLNALIEKTEWPKHVVQRKLGEMGTPVSTSMMSLYFNGKRQTPAYPVLLNIFDLAKEQGVDVEGYWEEEKQALQAEREASGAIHEGD